jgi:hypothetical protein
MVFDLDCWLMSPTNLGKEVAIPNPQEGDFTSL